MSYSEKRTIVSLVTGAAILAAYCIYAFGRYQSGFVAPSDLKAWAVMVLGFIAIEVVASIIIQIIFHILLSVAIAAGKKIQDAATDGKEISRSINAEMITDEMDRLIELKSMRIGYFLSGFGFVASVVSLVLGYSPVVMLNILFISLGAGSLVQGFAQLYFYRKGVIHG